MARLVVFSVPLSSVGERRYQRPGYAGNRPLPRGQPEALQGTSQRGGLLATVWTTTRVVADAGALDVDASEKRRGLSRPTFTLVPFSFPVSRARQDDLSGGLTAGSGGGGRGRYNNNNGGGYRDRDRDLRGGGGGSGGAPGGRGEGGERRLFLHQGVGHERLVAEGPLVEAAAHAREIVVVVVIVVVVGGVSIGIGGGCGTGGGGASRTIHTCVCRRRGHCLGV